MGIPVSQRPGRAADPDPEPRGQADEVYISERRHGTRKTLIGGRLVTVRLGSDASGLALDLSEFGIGLRAFPDLTVGSTTSLLFDLPGFTCRVEAVGKVEWVERAGSLWSKGSGGRAGLSFIELSDSARSILKQWISEDLPRMFSFKPAVPPPSPGPEDSGPRSSSLAAEMRDQLQRSKLSGLPALQWITERVLEHSPATGAAIALDDGQGMVCRATLGNAPDLGVRIHSSGLSGECVRTGKMVRCDDTESDPRVDPALCRQLNLRCALVLPVYYGEALCGVLEVFSAKPQAFAADTVALLQAVCGLVVEIVSQMAPQAAGDEAGMLSASNASPGLPDEIGPGGREQSYVGADENRQQGSPIPHAAGAPRRSVRSAALAGTIRCDVCGHANPRGQRICSNCDVPLSVVENYLGVPTSEQVREAEAAALLARSRYGTGESVAPVPSEIKAKQRDLRPLAGVAALLVLGFLGLGLWKGSQSKPAAPQSQAAATVQAQPAPSATPDVAPVAAPPAPVVCSARTGGKASCPQAGYFNCDQSRTARVRSSPCAGYGFRAMDLEGDHQRERRCPGRAGSAACLHRADSSPSLHCGGSGSAPNATSSRHRFQSRRIWFGRGHWGRTHPQGCSRLSANRQEHREDRLRRACRNSRSRGSAQKSACDRGRPLAGCCRYRCSTEVALSALSGERQPHRDRNQNRIPLPKLSRLGSLLALLRSPRHNIWLPLPAFDSKIGSKAVFRHPIGG